MDQLDHLGWVAQRSYEIGGIGFGVRTNSEKCAVWLDETLGEYAIPDEIDPYYSLLIGEGDRPGKRFHILYIESRGIVKTHDLTTLGQAFLSQLESLRFESLDDALYAKAGFFTLNGAAALVPGTLVEYAGAMSRSICLRSGLGFPITTRVAIDLASGLPLPISHDLHVPAEALGRLAQIGPSAPDRKPLLVGAPDRIDVVCSLGLIEEKVQPVSPALALYRIGSHVVNLHLLRQRGLDTLRRVVESARCYEISNYNKQADMLSAVAATLEA